MWHPLIIEDEALVAFHVGNVVAQAGPRSVSFARTCLEAVGAAMERRPEIIVSDVELLTGPGLTQKRAFG
jgi:DNA-binding NarL/FixJ family response regulator